MSAAFEAGARILARRLAQAVDQKLKEPRDPKDPPTDGQVAVMVIFDELAKMGYTLERR
jgi:hypothetical protein